MLLFSQINRINNKHHLQIAQSCIHANGVFATKKFYKGQVIEKAPIIIGTQKDYTYLEHTALHDYYFLLDNDYKKFALGLGFSSWYNHACPANASYKINIKKQFILFVAFTTINAGEEVTINYNGYPTNNNSIQFTIN